MADADPIDWDRFGAIETVQRVLQAAERGERGPTAQSAAFLAVDALDLPRRDARLAQRVLMDAADWVDPGSTGGWPEGVRTDREAYLVACAEQGAVARLRWLAHQYGNGNRPIPEGQSNG